MHATNTPWLKVQEVVFNVLKIAVNYSKTPLIQINWDGEPSRHAENLDNWIIFIIIIIIIVSFMQGIHTHIPETNHVPRGYIVAAILSLLFMVPLSVVLVLAVLFFYVSTFR